HLLRHVLVPAGGGAARGLSVARAAPGRRGILLARRGLCARTPLPPPFAGAPRSGSPFLLARAGGLPGGPGRPGRPGVGARGGVRRSGRAAARRGGAALARRGRRRSATLPRPLRPAAVPPERRRRPLGRSRGIARAAAAAARAILACRVEEGIRSV